jgi:hypothetical protein
VEAWRRTEAPLSTADPAAIAPAPAPHPAVTRPAQPKVGTAEKPLEGEPREAGESARPGPNLPRVAAVGIVAVGIAFSAGSADGAALGAGVGAAIGLAFAGGAGAAIGSTVTLLGARRS